MNVVGVRFPVAPGSLAFGEGVTTSRALGTEQGSRLAVGIDPGLASTGLALVRARDTLVASHTITATEEPRRAHMVIGTLLWLDSLDAAPDFVALESFEHRAYLRTRSGELRRVNTSVDMGRLVERLRIELEVRGLRVVELSASETKAGYPSSQKALKLLLPKELRNRHERDAYRAAVAGLSPLRSMR